MLNTNFSIEFLNILHKQYDLHSLMENYYSAVEVLYCKLDIIKSSCLLNRIIIRGFLFKLYYSVIISRTKLGPLLS